MTDYTDVIIVGLGPTGATLANLLGALDLSVCVIEAGDAPYTLPRATHFDGEVMRVFQTIGLAEEILPFTHINPGMTFISSEHDVILEWPRPRMVGPQNWHPSYRFHQPALEDVLRKGLQRFPKVQVYTGCELVSLEQTRDSVIAQVARRDAQGTKAINGRYLVGCDGARSSVRRMMGCELEDLGSHEQWIVVDLLMDRNIEGLTDGTVQYCNPARPTTFMRCVGGRRRWEFMVMPGDDIAHLTTTKGIWSLLRPWLTQDDARIERAVPYVFHAAIARPWRVGRVLLAGDAAHQMPPFLGQGLCAGVRDASNLAWKLARVVMGASSSVLLDSYEKERSAHVRDITKHAVEIGAIIQATNDEQVRRRDEQLFKGNRQMKSLAPRLGAGLHRTEPSPAGAIASQPILASGQPLDDVVGSNFAVIGEREILDNVSSDTKELWRCGRVVCLADEAAAYLAELDAKAVIVWPDRYILGVANTSDDLDRISAYIPNASRQPENA
jgi:3-(3-hydroxy-phenyl)propionate hydroxylase